MQRPNLINKPRFVQRLQWVIDPVGYMESAAQQYPDIFSAEVVGSGDGRLVFVNHPQAIEEILTNDRKKFSAPGEANKILQPFVGNYSVFMLEGEHHKRQRQLMMPSFHGDRMRAYGELICNISKQVFSKLAKNQPFSARSVTQQISQEVILQIVFGLTQGERCQQLKHLLTKMLDAFGSPVTSSSLFFPLLQNLGAWSPWGRFLRQRQQIDELIYAEIAERRKKGHSGGIDILSLLMSATDEKGQAMTPQQLRDELMTLLVAGYETTASAMAWGLYWLHKQPQVREKLLDELDAMGDHPEAMSIFRLPYLSAVCYESLRITPVAMLTFPRLVQQTVELLGHKLEPGIQVVGCIYLLHHREDLYPQHQQFKPERFLDRQFSPYEFMPFGGGVRRCLGEALALFEIKLVLATIVSNYQLALADDQPETPRRRGITLAPNRGVKMLILA